MKYGLIDKCRACRSGKLEVFFDLGSQPFANSLLADTSDADPHYPLALLYCHDCSLVQLSYSADPGELFSQYVWVTGTSSTARNYADHFCSEVTKRINPSTENPLILEIASNDGTFLKPFKRSGFNVLGLDPAQNIVDMANDNEIETACGFWSLDTAKSIFDGRDKPAVIIARNVLPHVANLTDFVAGIEYCSDDNTLVAIEIHYSNVILDDLHYDSIYHEHLCYFTLGSAEPLLGQFGLHINDIMASPISGGSVVLFISKTKKTPSESLVCCRQNEQAGEVNSFSRWKKFADKSFAHKQKLLDIFCDREISDSSVSGYGASARSSTLLNFCGFDSSHLTSIADQNPMKQGRFTAGSHIPILGPDEVMQSGADVIFLLAWNFQEEIMKILKKKYGFSGRVIVPLPNDPRIISVE